jgi:hypothetical protein
VTAKLAQHRCDLAGAQVFANDDLEAELFELGGNRARIVAGVAQRRCAVRRIADHQGDALLLGMQRHRRGKQQTDQHDNE